ncbi:MAG: glycoside hydrolase family 3 protein [Sphingomonadales bacterium]|nr:glycoside hydrolase family 3 protein [Sphingomonadales bacterium]MBD3772071.1 glycoside hydrolase family 3 protein [Paracoccaceae bacterium]
MAAWAPEESQAIAAWPVRSPTTVQDAEVEAHIRAIVAGMTLEQKIGQMTQPDIRYITPDQVREHYIGTILNGGGAWPSMDKHASVADWAALADAYAHASTSTDMPVQIPILWGIDAVHGNNNVYGATLFPHNIGLGAAHDPELIERIGAATARSVRATGISWAFAPTLAVAENQRWGRAYESYSSDPAEVARNGAALVRGLQGDMVGEGAVLATAKHFVGDGGTYLGIDQGETRTSADYLARVHGAGYYATLDAHVQSVMVSYSSWTMDGRIPFGKMHGDKALVTGVLKQSLGFDGLVVSDWNAIEQVPGCSVDHCPQAINAGVDIFMVPEKWQGFIANTIADVREGRVPMARIDDAVTRILRVKFRLGLFDRPTSASRYTGDASAISDRPLAQEAVRKSVVLLKNDNGTLPLAPGKRVLVVGAAADSFADQSGGWSITWQGDAIDNGDFPNGETLLAGMQRVFGSANVTYSPDAHGVDPARFDVVVAVLSETPHAEMKGDVRWPAPLSHSASYPGDAALLARVSGKGAPVVTVLYSGRTVYTTDLLNQSDAFVAAFLPGTEAGAMADLMAGRNGLDFSGRLSFAWPNTPCISGGEPAGEALFPRNYGLSYRAGKKTGKLREAESVQSCP